ncbi:MAG TPA: hypothetical protein VKS22_01355 [Candidatus Binataceae bacterium]|nr:hypothetical protein [Candidatus Binataceae bacterium]
MKPSTHPVIVAVTAMLVIALIPIGASARPLGHEAQIVIDTILAVPKITPAAGFSAKMLEAPGELYDPLFMLTHGDGVWMNDDGRATDGHGSRLLAVSSAGKISVLMGADKLLPVTGFDLAPADFGTFGGQIFSLAQPVSAEKGALQNHVIQRINLAAQTASVFCTLPAAGNVAKGIAGYGVDARFGPAGSGFAGKFYSIAALNDMIYQTTADGVCKPFADLSQQGSPAGLTFTPDGAAMLVTVSPGEIVSSTVEHNGMIVKIAPDGKVDPTPVVTGLGRPMGIAVAPAGFGEYAGQIFVTDMGDIQVPVPQTQALKRDGKIYRVKDGVLALVASGFVNPSGLHFVGHRLWANDINGDFIAGMRELPDGFVVLLEPK